MNAMQDMAKQQGQILKLVTNNNVISKDTNSKDSNISITANITITITRLISA